MTFHVMTTRTGARRHPVRSRRIEISISKYIRSGQDADQALLPISAQTRSKMLLLPLVGAALAPIAFALGEQRVIYFPQDHTKFEAGTVQAVFSAKHDFEGFTIASKSDQYVVPFLLDSNDNVAIHLAAKTLAADIHKITGIEPRLYNDSLPSNISHAVIIGSLESHLVQGIQNDKIEREVIKGKWESYDVRVSKAPMKNLESGLVITGSDRVSCILK